MTKYDFRIRRQLYKRNSSDRFQNFDALERRYKSRKRAFNIVRLVIILIAIVIMIGMLVYVARTQNKAYKSPVTDGEPEIHMTMTQHPL